MKKFYCKIRSVMILFLITVTFFLSGCGVSSNDSNTNEKVLEYYDNSDCINIDVASGNSLCFDIVFFTKEKVKNV